MKISTRILLTLLINFLFVLSLNVLSFYHKIQEEKLYSIVEIESKKVSLILRLDNYALTARLAYKNIGTNGFINYDSIYKENLEQITYLIREIEGYPLNEDQKSILEILKQANDHTYTNGLFISNIIKSIEELTRVSYLYQIESFKLLKQFNKKINIIYSIVLGICLLFLLISVIFAYKHIRTPIKYLLNSIENILKGEFSFNKYDGKKVGEFVELIFYFSELSNYIKDMDIELKEKEKSSMRYRRQVDMLLLENKKLNELRPILKEYLHKAKNIDETVG